VDIEESTAWLEFDFQGQRIHWDLEVKDDWVDPNIFSKFVALFQDVESGARFTYGDLDGQDFLIGFSTEKQMRDLSALTGLKFEWLR
jgi:hypothetical protein